MIKFIYFILFLGLLGVAFDFMVDYQEVICKTKYILLPQEFKILCLDKERLK